MNSSILKPLWILLVAGNISLYSYILGRSHGETANEQLCHDVWEAGERAGITWQANEILKAIDVTNLFPAEKLQAIGITNLFPEPMSNPFKSHR